MSSPSTLPKKKYTKSEVLKLISLYREQECLWNTSSKIYQKNDLKIQALEKIGEEFNVSGEEIKKKLRCLRATYVQVKRKIKRRMKSEAYANKNYTPSLFWYEHMKFLDEAIVTRQNQNEKRKAIQATSIKVENDTSKTDDFEDVLSQQNTIPTPDCTDANLEQMMFPSPEKDKYESVINKLVEIAHTQVPEEDILTAFARSICVQLKSIPLIEAFKLMSDIQNMISKKCVEILTGPHLPTSTLSFMNGMPSSPSNSENSLGRHA